MEIIRTETKLCLCCMEEHDVQTVLVRENTFFKGKKVEFNAIYEYCKHTDAFIASEDMISANDASMKKTYHKEAGSPVAWES